MDKPFYEFTILEEAFRYEFTSVGNKVIEKVIIFEKTDLPNYFNLVLADILEDGTIDDIVESRNGDMEKILATTIHTIFAFIAHYPEAKIFFSGSSPSRTRLYNIILTKEFRNFKNFQILGLKNKVLLPFERNEIYEAFVIFKKK